MTDFKPRAGAIRFQTPEGDWLQANPGDMTFSTYTMCATEYFNGKEWKQILEGSSTEEEEQPEPSSPVFVCKCYLCSLKPSVTLTIGDTGTIRRAAIHDDKLKATWNDFFLKPTIKHYAYSCPNDLCGCLWRDNQNGTMSLFNAKQTSCDTCEGLPLSALIPLFKEKQNG